MYPAEFNQIFLFAILSGIPERASAEEFCAFVRD